MGERRAGTGRWRVGAHVLVAARLDRWRDGCTTSLARDAREDPVRAAGIQDTAAMAVEKRATMKQTRGGRGGLAVRRETVRVLTNEGLRHVMGGAGIAASDGLPCPELDDQSRHWQSVTCGTSQLIIEPEPRQPRQPRLGP
jgi:hypothetical protein